MAFTDCFLSDEEGKHTVLFKRFIDIAMDCTFPPNVPLLEAGGRCIQSLAQRIIQERGAVFCLPSLVLKSAIIFRYHQASLRHLQTSTSPQQEVLPVPRAMIRTLSASGFFFLCVFKFHAPTRRKVMYRAVKGRIK
jgi:hypothetical protein